MPNSKAYVAKISLADGSVENMMFLSAKCELDVRQSFEKIKAKRPGTWYGAFILRIEQWS